MTEKNIKRVIFTKDYPYAPKPQLPTRVYRADPKPQAVNEDCFNRAIAAGFAHEAPAKTKNPKAK